MASLTVGTFNCENLFIRYKFGSKVKTKTIEEKTANGFMIDPKLFQRVLEKERKLTANAIKDTGADILGLQEVENLDTLKTFHSRFVKQFPFQYLVDGNDPRFIDIGVLSKHRATYIQTHQFDTKSKRKIFSRDCLELEFDISGTPLTLFVNHFKSMLGGREETMAKRKMQAERVVEIIKEKFGNNPGNENFIVMGDLNDFLPSTGLKPLLSQPWLENVLKRLPQNDQWTHWYDADKSVAQLDYLLLSKRLSQKNPDVLPTIVRKGIPTKATQYAGPRYAGVGALSPAASDHCPVSIKLDI